ncbi:transposase [Acidipropionibacterium jensenii]|uniref:transposase n=1 Tax=Acidipropionibacterium jensenii TaxID=1749 RepID=UPI000BC2E3F6|nr:transposase [Acidipropionibacterium jensenii]
MGSTRRKFTDEYRSNAVDLVLSSDRSIANVAHSIGVHEHTLGKWVKKAREENEDGHEKPLNESERQELDRLRKESAQAKMEIEFAKKVAAWFAKDQQ